MSLRPIKEAENGLNQTLKIGDIILAFRGGEPEVMVVRGINGWFVPLGNMNPYYSRILGIRVSAWKRQRYDQLTQKYVMLGGYDTEVRKVSFQNLHITYRLNHIRELEGYGFPVELIDLVALEQTKVLEGKYEKKKKKDE
jgi:hypothetical protein